MLKPGSFGRRRVWHPIALLALLALPLCNALAEDGQGADRADLGAYRAANHDIAAIKDSRRLVSMGDSITEFRYNEKTGFFSNRHRIGGGISGQITAQMPVRFRQNVIALKPRAVVILAGINDIAGITGPATVEEIQGNIASMEELARANHIKVVLATLVPTARYPWAPETDPTGRISSFNARIREYAHRRNFALADFQSPMATPERALRATLGEDGVHPDAAGYAIMEAVLAPILELAGVK